MPGGGATRDPRLLMGIGGGGGTLALESSSSGVEDISRTSATGGEDGTALIKLGSSFFCEIIIG